MASAEAVMIPSGHRAALVGMSRGPVKATLVAASVVTLVVKSE